MKNYHQLLAYIIKGIALVSLPILATTDPALTPTEVQARLKYLHFKELISDFQTQDFDSELFSGLLFCISHVLQRISQLFPFVIEENSSTD